MEISLSEKTLDVNTLEKEILKYVCELGKNMMKSALEMIDKQIAAERDTSIYENRGARKTTFKSIMGDVEYERNLYRIHDKDIVESIGKSHVFLLNQVLGFDTIGLISTTLAKSIAESACSTSYAETAKRVTELTGQSISRTGVWNVVQALGERVSDQENELVKAYDHDELNGELEREVIFEEADGVMIPLQGKDRQEHGKNKELKIAMSYDGWVQTGKDRYELHNKDVTVGYDKMSVIKAKKEAKIAKKYNTDKIKLRVFNSDGAKNLKLLHEEGTEFQLDRFHVEQDIRRKIKNKEAREKAIELYETNEPEKLLTYLDALSNSVDDEKEAEKLLELYTYLNNNKEGLLPYKERGIKIPKAPEGLEYRSMGTCEHNVYNIAAKRMKNHGASWSIKGSLNLGKLLALKVTHELSETIENLSKVLPERYKDDIIKILSAAKVPTTIGTGYIGRHSEIPFTNASVTEGRKTIQRIFGMQAFSEMKIRF